MWRNYVICVLIGLLLATSASSFNLLRQTQTQQADTNTLRQRAVAAESTSTSLQQQLSSQSASTQSGATPDTAAQAPAGPQGDRIVTPGPTATPQPVSIAPIAAAPTRVAAPAPTVTSGDSPLIQQIEQDVSTLRGLQPKNDVPIQFLNQTDLNRVYLDRFNDEYLPNERESDQKLLATLGLIGPNENVVQILLGVLQEQVLGVYNQDDKTMYMLADNGKFGPDEKVTFAQEFDHALQDQYFDLSTLAPKNPDNDDRSLAIEALTQGDATLIQRLWGQKNLSSDELSQIGQSGSTSKLLSAPLFLREQLLFPYSDGFNFVRQIYQTSGYAGIDDVFRDPPQSTAQILHIDKYRGHVAPVEVDLPDLSQGQLGDGWRDINSNVFGELDLRLLLTQLTDSTTGVRAASGWSGDRWELLEKDGRQAVAIKSQWDSASDANTFFQAMSQGLQNRFFGAQVEEASATRNALTATNAATEVRKTGSTVLVVISFDRPSAEAIAGAIS